MMDPKPAVIMVDDSAADLTIAGRCYRKSRLDHPWQTFGDAEPFIEHMRAVLAGDAPRPAMVLLDINMRGMSGFEVLTWLRSNDAFSQVPVVVMLSNSDAREDIDRAHTLGADGYRTKPLSLADYVALFDQLAEVVAA